VGKDQAMIIVTNAINGMMEAWTFIPTTDMSYLNNQRVGKLLWKRD
jgi:hypothetical protein